MQASINSQGVGNRGTGSGNNQYGMSLGSNNNNGNQLQEKQPKITINLMDVSFLEQNLQ